MSRRVRVREWGNAQADDKGGRERKKDENNEEEERASERESQSGCKWAK